MINIAYVKASEPHRQPSVLITITQKPQVIHFIVNNISFTIMFMTIIWWLKAVINIPMTNKYITNQIDYIYIMSDDGQGPSQ